MSTIPPPPPNIYPGQQQEILPWQQTDISMEGEKTLIVRDGTTLPPVCIATGKMDNLVKRKRKESWTPPWVWILLLVGLLVVIIVGLCVSKYGRIEYYQTKEYRSKRIKILIGNWCLFLGSLIAAIFSFAANIDLMVAVGFLFLLIAIAGPLIVYFVFLNIYTVLKIDKGYMWLKFRDPEMAKAIYNASLNRQALGNIAAAPVPE